MNNKFYWGIGTLFILLIIGATVIVLVKDQAVMRQLETELEALQKRKEDQKPPEVSKEEHPEHGHFHEDGTFHVGEHDDPIHPLSRDYTPTQIQIPDGITDPEVKAAWKRLDYIANNIWEWGGVPSARAEELIVELMPPPTGFFGEEGHHELEGTLDLLSELKQFRDPRAAEVFATYAGEGIVGGNAMNEALVEIGVPSVPFLIPYIEPPYDRLVKNPTSAAFALGHIGAKHRDELEGVIEHIIIPKLEALMKSNAPLMSFPQMKASKSLKMLKK